MVTTPLEDTVAIPVLLDFHVKESTPRAFSDASLASNFLLRSTVTLLPLRSALIVFSVNFTDFTVSAAVIVTLKLAEAAFSSCEVAVILYVLPVTAFLPTVSLPLFEILTCGSVELILQVTFLFVAKLGVSSALYCALLPTATFLLPVIAIEVTYGFKVTVLLPTALALPIALTVIALTVYLAAPDAFNVIVPLYLVPTATPFL